MPGGGRGGGGRRVVQPLEVFTRTIAKLEF